MEVWTIPVGGKVKGERTVDNIYVATGGSAVLLATLLQLLKNSPYFPWLSRQTGKVNLLASVVLAFFASAGISHHFDFSGDGTFAFGLEGNLYDVWHFIVHWAIQWASQHSFYKGFIVPAETLGETRAILKSIQDLLEAAQKLAGALLLPVLLAVSLSACATVDSVNATAAKTVKKAIDISEQYHCGPARSAPCLTDDQFKGVNLELARVSTAGKVYTQLSIDGKATWKDAATFLGATAKAVADLSASYGDTPIGGVLAELLKLVNKLYKLVGVKP